VALQPKSGLDRLVLRFADRTQLDTHTHTHTRSRTPLNEWSARRRGKTQHATNTRDGHPLPQRDSKPQSKQPERLQTYALDRTVTGIHRAEIYKESFRAAQQKVTFSSVLPQEPSIPCNQH